jgi:two-component system response regulator FlrC
VPVGSRTERRVDVRVIASTNKDLEKEIKEGRFREDLYYRLNGFPIRVPALREHPSDIPLLVREFLGTMEIEEGALELLCGNHWRGNVRELKAVIERLTLCAAAEGARVITADQARGEIGAREKISAEGAAADAHLEKRQDVIKYAGELRIGESIDEHFERQKLAVYKQLVRSAGGVAKAAERLGETHSALYHRMERLQHRVESD